MKNIRLLLVILCAGWFCTAHASHPDILLECAEHTDCPDGGYFCAKEPGNCQGKGQCSTRPHFCTDEYAPVCGCDGQTYGNPCEASMAGVNIVHKGACETGSCATNRDCVDGAEYCAKADGDCLGRGICSKRPEACFDLFQPVCGCDGVTYGNGCEAARAGTTVAYQGECKTVQRCVANNDCADANDYCAKEAGNCDGVGICKDRPELCTTVYDPVCGCDGQTYSNACVAASTGTNAAALGECPPRCEPTSDKEKGRMCRDGIDNDCDGLTDADDPDCAKGRR